ncbi:MAG: alkaline phosphatase family protein, partial [Anaerolineaceae bacterium]|nr:alkaline phosphatase family protein [Anaerolineaceae bacterium]
MRKFRTAFILVPIFLILSVISYLWADTITSSFNTYRSPLHGNPPAAGSPIGEPATRRVVFVIIDGLRLDTSEMVDVMPFLNQLRDQGASAASHSQPPSSSQPGYSTLMTGTWPELNDGPAQ